MADIGLKDLDRSALQGELLATRAPVQLLPSFQLRCGTRLVDRASPDSPVTRISPEEVATFLGYVVAGKQKEAEELLMKSPILALANGDVTDSANRTFNNITGLQYAIWSLDWHMWTMILQYLLPTDVNAQLASCITGSWVPIHQKNAAHLLQKLAQELQIYLDMPYEHKKCTEQWVKNVGEAQRNCPMHVLHEYCHPKRSFYPIPLFTEAVFPRFLNIDILKCGIEFAIYRGPALGCSAGSGACDRTCLAWAHGAAATPVGRDHAAIIKLLQVRTMQFEELLKIDDTYKVAPPKI